MTFEEWRRSQVAARSQGPIIDAHEQWKRENPSVCFHNERAVAELRARQEYEAFMRSKRGGKEENA